RAVVAADRGLHGVRDGVGDVVAGQLLLVPGLLARDRPGGRALLTGGRGGLPVLAVAAHRTFDAVGRVVGPVDERVRAEGDEPGGEDGADAHGQDADAAVPRTVGVAHLLYAGPA